MELTGESTFTSAARSLSSIFLLQMLRRKNGADKKPSYDSRFEGRTAPLPSSHPSHYYFYQLFTLYAG